MEGQLNFGVHLTIDGYGGDEEKLNDKELVRKSLGELAKIMEMNALCDPQVYFAEPNHIKDPGGWSGFILIAESHITIHTFPKRGFLSADVYTCKSTMDQEKALNFFKEKFDLKDLEVNFIKRGTKYPVANIY